jgi:ATP-dependent DNA ligase
VNHVSATCLTCDVGRYPGAVADTSGRSSASRHEAAQWWPDGVTLAKPVEALPPRNALPEGCLYEPKWDGYRALIRVDDDGARIRSRRGTDLTSAFPDVAAAAAEQLHPGTLLDGELVIWDTDRDGLDFAALQRRLASAPRVARLAARQPASFVAFDILLSPGVRRRSRLRWPNSFWVS